MEPMITRAEKHAALRAEERVRRLTGRNKPHYILHCQQSAIGMVWCMSRLGIAIGPERLSAETAILDATMEAT